MEFSKEPAKSRLKISDDVIITVAKLAALDVKGVAGLGGEIKKSNKLRKNGPIKISMMGDVAAIDMKIIVKENVQNMTGVTVARVNVTVSGVVFE